MSRTLTLLLLLVIGAPVAAQAPTPAPPPPPAAPDWFAVTYVDVAPTGAQAMLTAYARYRDASRKDDGYVAMELLEQLGRPAHYVVLERWRDQKAFEAHAAAPHTRQYRDALQPVRVSGYDERPYTVLAVGPAAAARAPSAIHIVSHVDFAGQGAQAQAPGLLTQLADASRREPGNLRFDVVQHAMRRNHFTVVETWRDQAALDAHTTATHTKQYREALTPITGSPLDENAYRSAEPAGQAEVVDPARSPLPNPAADVLKNWGKLPGGRTWGSSAGVDIGPDGHIWTYDRCGGVALTDAGCDTSTLDPIVKLDRATGQVLASFGAGLFVLPHGIHVDRDGNVWVTDSQGNKAGTKGHQVIKFSPDGKVLMRLGRAGVAGSGPDTLNEPCDVITAPNGDIFVADGHSGQNPNPPPGATGRIVKFSRDGTFIKEWGRIGSGPGEFRTPHALAFDSRGRLFVADRGNHRIQIFDQDGRLLDTWHQFSRVSGLFIDRSDTFYAIDSESNDMRHPGWKTGVRIGTTREDKVVAFIPPHDNGASYGAAGEGVAVDRDGNVYAAEGPSSRPVAGGGLTKYVKRGQQ